MQRTPKLEQPVPAAHAAVVVSGLLLGLLLAAVPPVAAQHGPYAYVPNAGDDTVSVIGITREAVLRTVPVGLEPIAVAVTPDGAQVYIANSGEASVSVLDGSSHQVIATVPVGEGPISIAAHPSGDLVYVASAGTLTLSLIDTKSLSVFRTIDVNIPDGIAVLAVAVHPLGDFVYVSNYRVVYMLDGQTHRRLGSFDIHWWGRDIVLSPDGTNLYVCNRMARNVEVFETATHTEVAQIAVGRRPSYAAVAPDGGTLYVLNETDDEMSIIDTSSNVELTRVWAGPLPSGVEVTPDGASVYVVSAGLNAVLVFDAAAGSIRNLIPVGSAPNARGDFIGP